MKKRILILLTAIALLLPVFSAYGCNNNGQVKATLLEVNSTMVVLRVDETDANGKLVDALNSVKGENFNYEIKGGFITSINGLENPSDFSYCWMIYSNDTDFAVFDDPKNTFVYNNQELGSVILGAEDLPVTKGCIYLLLYQKF